MALNKKDILLLEEINNNPCSIKYFADKYHVSERNIRYSVDNINFYLKKENIKDIEIKLGNLEFHTEKIILDKFIENLNMNTYAFSSEERESYILTEYFLSGQYVNFFYENLFIAERFISRFLRTLEKLLNMKFITNKDLAENLLKYLVPAIYRIKNNFYLHKDFEIILKMNKIDKNIMSAVKNGVLENNKYLLEPLRDEEILYIAEAVEKSIADSKTKKISLKKLTDIVEANCNVCSSDKIIYNIKKEFGVLIDDDINSVDNYNISNLLDKSRIFIYPETVSIAEAADKGINILVDKKFVKKDMLYNLKDLIQKFGKYMFIDKKILFCYNTNPENFLKSGLAVIISEKGIQVPESEDGNILFILSAENKIEHLKIISDLINLAENSSLEEIILFLKER